MKTVVLVPYRSDSDRRDRLWDFTRDWLQRHHHDWPILVGESPDGPFNRSAAINHAAAQADWDIAIISDADTVVPPRQLRAAHARASLDDRLCAAFTSVAELTQVSTEHLLTTGDVNLCTLEIEHLRTIDIETQSSVLVCNRFLWDKIGGFDEKFVSWGGEDNAFWKAATIVGGSPHRIFGHAFHLWHEWASDRGRRNAEYQANLARWHRYQRARNASQLATIRNS